MNNHLDAGCIGRPDDRTIGRSDELPWLELQLADSAFPAGGLAHAGGLEAALAFAAVRGRDGVAGWIGRSLDAAAGLALPLCAAGWDDPAGWAATDDLADACILGHVANRASRTQGQSFLAAAAGAFGVEAIADLRRAAVRDRRPAHLSPAFGVCTRLLGLGRTASLRLHLHGQMRALVTAAVRLNAIGPLEAQALHHRLAPRAEAAVERASAMTPDDIAATDPMLDLVQGCQDRLYSRLFTS